jgi:multidrug resistance efflux pump
MANESSSSMPSGRENSVTPDPRRALAVGLELAKNAARASSIDELQFILVNDTRALLPFDRSLLVIHLGGKSDLAAVNNQSKLESKSDFVQHVKALSPALKEIKQGLMLLANSPKSDALSAETQEALESYLQYSKCNDLIILPLVFEDSVIAHLLFEFQADVRPGEVETFTLTTMLPFFSSALMEKWIRSHDRPVSNAFAKAISPKTSIENTWSRNKKIAYIVAAVLCLLLLLCTPFTLTVGGRADVAPEFEYYAYVQMEGTVDRVLVKEGDSVKKDQVIAILEDKEIQYKIREQQRLLAEYKAEIDILRSQSAENQSKLADSQLVAIKAQRAQQELDFLKWQEQFLQIWSPVDGVVLTKKLESQLGKRFKAGEPFCKLSPSDTLLTEIFVREDDVSYVKEGQSGEVFFNVQPNVSHPIKVKSIAPISEPLERVGSVFRVRATFDKQPGHIRPGMAGTGHISTLPESLWFQLTRRLRNRLNEILIHF